MLRPAVAVSLVVIGLGVASCGQYAPGADAGPPTGPTQGERTAPPGSGTPEGEGEGDGSGAEDGIPTTYAWGLPPSDVSLTGNDGPAYSALRHGCAAAEEYLAAAGADRPFTSNPYGFLNARYTEFYAAGIALCRGDVGTARIYRDHAVARWGTEGIDRPGDPKSPDGTDSAAPPRPPGYGEPECDLYRTLAGVLDQVAPESVACPRGAGPGHVFLDYIVDDGQGPYTTSIYDDPLTLDVEEHRIAPANLADAQPEPEPTVPDEGDLAPDPEATADPSAPPPGEVTR